MKVHLSAIPEEEGLTVTFSGKDAAWEGLAGILMEALPAGELVVERLGKDVLVRGRFSAVARFGCSRCLEEFSYPVEMSFRHTLRPLERVEGDIRDLELVPEDLEYGYYEEDLVCLDRLVEEHLVLSLPMKPLCQEDCRGLCPRCGANQNVGECQCPATRGGSPFEILKNHFIENK